jgi:hypothetical protein
LDCQCFSAFLGFGKPVLIPAAKQYDGDYQEPSNQDGLSPLAGFVGVSGVPSFLFGQSSFALLPLKFDCPLNALGCGSQGDFYQDENNQRNKA